MDVNALIVENSPLLSAILIALLGGFLRGTLRVVESRFKIQIDDQHRELIHRAMITGLTGALQRSGIEVLPEDKGQRSQLIEDAIEHVTKYGASKAVSALGVRSDALRSLAEAKLSETFRRIRD